jgi:hemoglobin-like flavoprotein
MFPWGKGDCEEEDFFGNPKFLMFARNFVQMLDLAVEILGPDLEVVEDQLQSLGASHSRYGVTARHFKLMGHALICTLESMLGPRSFNKEKRESWEVVYTYMSDNMIKGAAIV